MTATSEELQVEQRGSLLVVTLNRPQVLNSLTLGMVRGIEALLDRAETDAGIAALLFIGAGDRAFCAGGDIRALYDAGKAGDPLPATFWREEYRLNERMSRFAKPLVSVTNGITMGGGVGIAAHCRYRIATEKTRFAMPEAGIGFFPDVGASWLLTRDTTAFGMHVALTGDLCGAGDTIRAGIADCYMPLDRLETLCEGLAALPSDDAMTAVGTIIAGLAEAPPAERDAETLALIERAFAGETIETILATLDGEPAAAAGKLAAAIRAKSPTSLKLTLRLYRDALQAADLRTCLEREFVVTGAMIRNPDFYEGVRAAVIDKDRNPRWNPASLADVSDAVLAPFLTPSEPPLFS